MSLLRTLQACAHELWCYMSGPHFFRGFADRAADAFFEGSKDIVQQCRELLSLRLCHIFPNQLISSTLIFAKSPDLRLHPNFFQDSFQKLPASAASAFVIFAGA